MMIRARCLKCDLRVEHPWHDNGDRNQWNDAKWHDWRLANGGPNMDEERKEQEQDDDV